MEAREYTALFREERAGYNRPMADDYAGDIPPKRAWEILNQEPDSILIDVRTDAEWIYVGMPDLAPAGKEPAKIAWQVFPKMEVNPKFVDEVAAIAPKKDAALLFLCRSGVRSKSAAIALTKAGYTRCYNIAEGFEGDKDAKAHRATIGGWKVAGLPWKQ
jgi:rhodanese-related sulfurtransferase